MRAIPVVCGAHFPSRIALSHRESESLGKDLQGTIEGKHLAETFHWAFTTPLVSAHDTR